MVGELLDLSMGRRTEESLTTAYETGERGLLGKTMPAKGLTLVSVEYNERN
jgi:tRNA U38,U39,U40 pseudouridine synthase TruA